MNTAVEDFWTDSQKEDLKFFHENLDKYLEDPLYAMKYLLIHKQQVFGLFDTFENAITRAAAKLQQGDYVIQQVISPDEVINFLYPAVAFS
jgi:hypothetical protein